MIKTEEWGLIDYEAALGRQTTLYNEAIATKLAGGRCDETVITCQHNHVYTLGKSGKDSNMLLSTQRLASLGVQLYHIKRGGDITYHGPGQIVMYPIIDLEQHHIGLKDYVWRLEESVITTAGDYGITCGRLKGATGVWIDAGRPTARKICAIGVQSSHYVTMHGLALNVNTDLSYFNNINPCGFTDKGVTSMAVECGTEINIKEVRDKLVSNFLALI